MAFTPKNKKSNSFNVDWEYANEQLEDLIDVSSDARIAVLIDLGEHHQGIRLSDKGQTIVSTEEEAYDLIDQAQDIVGLRQLEQKKWNEFEELDGAVYKLPFKIVQDKYVFPNTEEQDNSTYADTKKEAQAILNRALELDKYGNLKKADADTYEEIKTPFKLPFNLYDAGEETEFGLLADLTDTQIKYSKDTEPVNYRVNLCSVFKGKMTGFPILESYTSKSIVSRICKATANKHILTDSSKLTDLVGSPYLQVLEENGGFVNPSREFGTPRPKDLESIPPLNIKGYPEGIAIEFETATVEQLEAANINKTYLDKIKSALNYEGSVMQAAVEEYEVRRNSGGSSTSDQEEEEEAPKSKPKTKAKAKSAETQKTEDDDGENPFD